MTSNIIYPDPLVLDLYFNNTSIDSILIYLHYSNPVILDIQLVEPTSVTATGGSVISVLEPFVLDLTLIPVASIINRATFSAPSKTSLKYTNTPLDEAFIGNPHSDPLRELQLLRLTKDLKSVKNDPVKLASGKAEMWASKVIDNSSNKETIKTLLKHKLYNYNLARESNN